MEFFPADDLRSDEIFLRLDRTCEAQPEKKWVPAYYFSVCLPDGTEIGHCDLRIGHNERLYIGGNDVIEAQGTKAGVIKSKADNKKWTWWGELKGVDYGGNVNQGFPEKTGWHPTVRRGMKGDDVRELQSKLYKLGYNLGSYGIDGDFGRATEAAVKEFQEDHKLTVDGVAGPMTWDALDKAVQNVSSKPAEKKYTVCIHGLDKTQADALLTKYPGATCTEE